MTTHTYAEGTDHRRYDIDGCRCDAYVHEPHLDPGCPLRDRPALPRRLWRTLVWTWHRLRYETREGWREKP